MRGDASGSGRDLPASSAPGRASTDDGGLSPDRGWPADRHRAALQELVDHIRAAGRFAFDTEFVSEDTFEPVLCLIQVATATRLAVVDPLRIDDLAPFWEVVNDPSIEVVMHAAGEDLRICRFQTGKVPKRVFDVQIAAGLVGYSYPLSLGNLVHQTLKVSVQGGETRTDWRRRPLSDAQLRYALDDVRYLLELADFLTDRLARLNRVAWADTEFATFLHAIDHRSEEERWRRLPGLHLLNRRGLEVARRLFDWRIADARRSNRPLRSILKDDLLVAVARRQPANRKDLEALRDFNRHALLSRVQEILDVLLDARNTPEDQLPEPASRHDDRPGLAMVVSLLAADPVAVLRPGEGRRRPGRGGERPQGPRPLVRRRQAARADPRTPARLAQRGLRPDHPGRPLRPPRRPDRRPRGRRPRRPRPGRGLNADPGIDSARLGSGGSTVTAETARDAHWIRAWGRWRIRWAWRLQGARWSGRAGRKR